MFAPLILSALLPLNPALPTIERRFRRALSRLGDVEKHAASLAMKLALVAQLIEGARRAVVVFFNFSSDVFFHFASDVFWTVAISTSTCALARIRAPP